MKRLYYSDASDTPPALPKSPASGKYPQDGNRATKQMPTVIGAYWYYMINEELMAVIEGAGVTPDAANVHQLADIFEDFRTRASKAEGYATAASASADRAETAAQGVIDHRDRRQDQENRRRGRQAGVCGHCRRFYRHRSDL